MAGELGEMGGGSVAESLVPHVQLEPENVLIVDAAVPGIDGRPVKDGHRFELILRQPIAMVVAVRIVTDGQAVDIDYRSGVGKRRVRLT